MLFDLPSLVCSVSEVFVCLVFVHMCSDCGGRNCIYIIVFYILFVILLSLLCLLSLWIVMPRNCRHMFVLLTKAKLHLNNYIVLVYVLVPLVCLLTDEGF